MDCIHIGSCGYPGKNKKKDYKVVKFMTGLVIPGGTVRTRARKSQVHGTGGASIK